MAQVNVTINGRQYRMACEDGEEERLRQLANDLDARVVELRAKFGEIGDARLVVMAALTIADELADAGKMRRQLEEEIAALQNARAVAADRMQAVQAAVVATLNSAADRIESIAKKLNDSIAAEGAGMG